MNLCSLPPVSVFFNPSKKSSEFAASSVLPSAESAKLFASQSAPAIQSARDTDLLSAYFFISAINSESPAPCAAGKSPKIVSSVQRIKRFFIISSCNI